MLGRFLLRGGDAHDRRDRLALFVERDLDGPLRQRFGTADPLDAFELRVLTAVCVDDLHRLHALGDEFGDLRLIIALLGGDSGFQAVILTQRRAGLRSVQSAAIGRDGVEHIAAAAESDLRLLLRQFEGV